MDNVNKSRLKRTHSGLKEMFIPSRDEKDIESYLNMGGYPMSYLKVIDKFSKKIYETSRIESSGDGESFVIYIDELPSEYNHPYDGYWFSDRDNKCFQDFKSRNIGSLIASIIIYGRAHLGVTDPVEDIGLLMVLLEATLNVLGNKYFKDCEHYKYV